VTFSAACLLRCMIPEDIAIDVIDMARFCSGIADYRRQQTLTLADSLLAVALYSPTGRLPLSLIAGGAHEYDYGLPCPRLF
jgi:hypothetical protein